MAAVAHPCPTPTLRKRERRDGYVWACECGKLYVQRFHYTWAGEDWDWVDTGLRTLEAAETSGRYQ